MQVVTEWWNRELYQPLFQMTSSQRIAAITVGVVGGLFPVPCVTTGVTFGLSRLVTLNTAQSAVSLAINLSVWPLELVLIPYLAVGGSWITGADSSLFTADSLLRYMDDGLVSLVTNGVSLLAHAVLLWFALAIASVAALRVLCCYFFPVSSSIGK